MPFDWEEYENSIHKTGIIMVSVGIALIISVPFIFAKILSTSIDWSGFAHAILRVGPTYWAISIVEFLVYVPLLGAGGSYLAFITGNIINMKLPCVFYAKDIAKVEEGTKESSIISTLSIASSALMTMLVIFLGVLMIVPLTPILENRYLQPAFANILPSLFGALAAQYFTKSWKITIIPLAISIVLTTAVPSLINQTSVMMIPAGGVAIAIAFFLYKTKRLEKKKEAVNAR